MSEKFLRKRVVRMLQPLRAFAVENAVGIDGIPDVCCVAGWLELKLATKPMRETTKVAVDLRPAQRIWLRGWRQGGGRAWALTVIDQTWYLHDGLWAAEYLGDTTLTSLISGACAVWPHGPSQSDFVNTLASWRSNKSKGENQ